MAEESHARRGSPAMQNGQLDRAPSPVRHVPEVQTTRCTSLTTNERIFMGLDMYLTGTIYLKDFITFPRKRGTKKAELIDLGYWRKHPNLHGYIVQNFADGVDECQEIPLDADRIRQIMQAVKDKTLPHTTGFFFGVSEGTAAERKEDLEIFQGALDWLLAAVETDTLRHVTYQASW
jgi:hypothetical protein